MSEYCTKITSESEGIKIVNIAKSCNLKFYYMNSFPPFNDYFILCNESNSSFDIHSLNMSAGKELSNIDFVSCIYEYSCLKTKIE